MNVLLIYPKFPDTFWSFTYALSFIGKKAAFPPLGLLTVATLLPEQWPKRLVDVNVDNLTDKDLLWADMAFIGGMAIQRKSAEHIIARCNASNLKVVAGGRFLLLNPVNSRRWIIWCSTKRNSRCRPFCRTCTTDNRKRSTGLRVSAILATPRPPRGIL